MPIDGDRTLFDQVDANRDGKIDEGEFSNWARREVDGGVTTYTTRYDGDVVTSYGATDSGADFAYRSSADTVFDRMDLNRDNVVDRSEFNRYYSGGTVVGASSSSAYVTTYATDSRGFFLDPNPEIITRTDSGPAQTYTQNITIRYLEPPPLPPSGPNIIREVRPPPLQAPPPFLIREPGKPAYQPPPLILRERPPEPPPASAPIDKTVFLPPHPAPPRSVITEKYPDQPDRPRDIILERWLPYEARAAQRTVRIAAAAGPLPTPPRNKIIRYLPVEARIVRQFQRLGVTRADPKLYLQQYGSSLLDTTTFLQEARTHGVFEDLSLPASGYTTTSVGYTPTSVGYTRRHDIVDTAFHVADTNNDGTLSRDEFNRFVRQGT